jgi:hypothetical protein
MGVRIALFELPRDFKDHSCLSGVTARVPSAQLPVPVAALPRRAAAPAGASGRGAPRRRPVSAAAPEPGASRGKEA